MQIPSTGRDWGSTVSTHRAPFTVFCIPRTPLKLRYSKCSAINGPSSTKSIRLIWRCLMCSELLVTSPLKVVNATGRHLNRLGTDSGFFASTDYSKTQAWARSFMTHHQAPHGIRYNSRKNPARINYRKLRCRFAICGPFYRYRLMLKSFWCAREHRCR
jgi:hypothetical protein